MPKPNRTPSAGLAAHYAKASEASATTVAAAIKKIVNAGQRVTLSGIVEHSLGRISHTTILRNPKCRALYDEATAQESTPRTRTRRRLRLTGADQREVTRAAYLLRKTKEEIIRITIQAERDLRIEREHTANLRDKLLRELATKGGKATR